MIPGIKQFAKESLFELKRGMPLVMLVAMLVWLLSEVGASNGH
jgi:hypothetical protein